jgi:hypothetical protein
LPGELENDGTFLAHSVVFWPVDCAKLLADKVPSNGEVILGTLVAVETGLTSDLGATDGGDGVAGLLSSLLKRSAVSVPCFTTHYYRDYKIRIPTYSIFKFILTAVAAAPLLSFAAAAFLLSFLDGMVAAEADDCCACFWAKVSMMDVGLGSRPAETGIQKSDGSCI